MPGVVCCVIHEMTTEVSQPIPFNANPSHLSWERLETTRLRRLGIPTRYSRHCNIVYNSQIAAMNAAEKNQQCLIPSTRSEEKSGKKTKTATNSLAPFYTHEKRTCGYFFSRDTDNRMRNIGIPPSDIMSWRSNRAVQ